MNVLFLHVIIILCNLTRFQDPDTDDPRQSARSLYSLALIYVYSSGLFSIFSVILYQYFRFKLCMALEHRTILSSSVNISILL